MITLERHIFMIFMTFTIRTFRRQLYTQPTTKQRFISGAIYFKGQ